MEKETESEMEEDGGGGRDIERDRRKGRRIEGWTGKRMEEEGQTDGGRVRSCPSHAWRQLSLPEGAETRHLKLRGFVSRVKFINGEITLYAVRMQSPWQQSVPYLGLTENYCTDG